MNLRLTRIAPRAQWLTVAALVVGGLLFGMPYLLRAIFAVGQFTHLFDSPNTFSWLAALFSWLIILFSEAWAYVLISLLGIGLIVAALRRGRPSRVVRSLLVLTLLAILGFPWFFRDEPAVSAAPGYTLRWPTQPGLLEGVVKRAHITTEQRPCTYTLLGWSADASLYYRANCNGSDQIWRYNPNTSTSAMPITTTPTDLSIDVRAHSQVLELVRIPSIYPPEAEPSTRSISVRDRGLASPDGRWVALIARHVYGPEDVIVVSSSPIDQ